MITMVKMFEMNFVNLFVWILCGIVPVFSIQIQHCNETAKSVTVCRLVENYNYNPMIAPNPRPMNVKVIVDIIDIVDFDWKSNTITVAFQLWAMWNDTRITIADFETDEGYDYL